MKVDYSFSDTGAQSYKMDFWKDILDFFNIFKADDWGKVETNENLQTFMLEPTWGLTQSGDVLIWALCGNVLGSLLNLLIVLVIVKHEELRTSQLFPVVFQSVIDIVATGILPAIVNSATYILIENETSFLHKLADKIFETNFIVTDSWASSQFVPMFCKVYFVCDTITICSSGWNICAVAFLRYFSVCHPFKAKEWRDRKYFKKFNISVVCVISMNCAIFITAGLIFSNKCLNMQKNPLRVP